MGVDQLAGRLANVTDWNSFKYGKGRHSIVRTVIYGKRVNLREHCCYNSQRYFRAIGDHQIPTRDDLTLKLQVADNMTRKKEIWEIAAGEMEEEG